MSIPESAESAASAAAGPSTRLKLPPSALARLGEGQPAPLESSSAAEITSALSAHPSNPLSVAVQRAALRKVSGAEDAAPSPGGVNTLPTPVRLAPGGPSGYIKGYKDMPTLSQIRERIGKKAEQGEAGAGGSSSRQASVSPSRGKNAEVAASPFALPAGKPAIPVIKSSGGAEDAQGDAGLAAAANKSITGAGAKQADQHPLQNKW